MKLRTPWQTFMHFWQPFLKFAAHLRRRYEWMLPRLRNRESTIPWTVLMTCCNSFLLPCSRSTRQYSHMSGCSPWCRGKSFSAELREWGEGCCASEISGWRGAAGLSWRWGLSLRSSSGPLIGKQKNLELATRFTSSLLMLSTEYCVVCTFLKWMSISLFFCVRVEVKVVDSACVDSIWTSSL